MVTWLCYLEEIYYIFLVGDSMSSVNGVEKADGEMFSTFDNDHDSSNKHCASQGRSGWWYGDCTYGSLNGDYDNNGNRRGINWGTFRGISYSLKTSRIMLRRP